MPYGDVWPVAVDLPARVGTMRLVRDAIATMLAALFILWAVW